jgi:t-SNARE complex subunit (syntaxin)
MHIDRLTEADWQTNEALAAKVNELVEQLNTLREPGWRRIERLTRRVTHLRQRAQRAEADRDFLLEAVAEMAHSDEPWARDAAAYLGGAVAAKVAIAGKGDDFVQAFVERVTE